MFKNLLLLLSCLVLGSQQETIKVTVYYESLCPDSIRFLTKQFYQTYRELDGAQAIQIDLLPYGKAKHVLVDGKWQFICQHGKNECFGNKVQACVLNQLNDNPDKQVEFVNCAMSARYPADLDELAECAGKFEIDFDATRECLENGEGDRLLAELGDRTHAFQPSRLGVSYVPTIVFNDTYSAQLQIGALLNFKSTLCNLYDVETKPTRC